MDPGSKASSRTEPAECSVKGGTTIAPRSFLLPPPPLILSEAALGSAETARLPKQPATEPKAAFT